MRDAFRELRLALAHALDVTVLEAVLPRLALDDRSVPSFARGEREIAGSVSRGRSEGRGGEESNGVPGRSKASHGPQKCQLGPAKPSAAG
mgnify:CR=1 FL=1